MEHNSSWKLVIPEGILWTTKIHYHVYETVKFSVLSQMNPLHILRPYLYKNQLHITNPAILGL
jgi:hypothetical protein